MPYSFLQKSPLRTFLQKILDKHFEIMLFYLYTVEYFPLKRELKPNLLIKS